MLSKGRPRSIPNKVFGTILLLRKQGNGYRRITSILRKDHGVDTTKASVERFINSKPPYDKARAEHFKVTPAARHPVTEYRMNCNCKACIAYLENKRSRGSLPGITIFDERDRRRSGSSIRVKRWS